MRLPGLRAGWFVLGMASAHGVAASARPPEQVDYVCGDVVVIGRFENNGDYEHVQIGNDILGHGWMTASVNVTTLLAGIRPRHPIVVRYYGHTYFTEHRDFLLVLYREPGAEHFSLRLERLLERRDDAELASRCLDEFAAKDS